MDYTLAQVDAMEKRIKAEMPWSPHQSRQLWLESWCPSAPTSQKTFIVFDTSVHPDDTRPTILGDMDKIIAVINEVK